jgi:ethanolamine transporter EutH
MENVYTFVTSIYMALGYLATIYTIVFFIFTGSTVFDQGHKQKMPLRYKFSFVLVSALLMPYLYVAFVSEILSLHRTGEIRADQPNV